MGVAGLLKLKTLTQKWLFYKGNHQNHEFFCKALYLNVYYRNSEQLNIQGNKCSFFNAQFMYRGPMILRLVFVLMNSATYTGSQYE